MVSHSLVSDGRAYESSSLENALVCAAWAERLLIVVDFDGTIAELCDDPAKARPSPGAVEVIALLAALPGVHCAVVSSRSVADLRRILGDVGGAVLMGDGGLAEADVEMADFEEQEAALEGIAKRLRDHCSSWRGARVERRTHSTSLSVSDVEAIARGSLAEHAVVAAASMGAVVEAIGTHTFEFQGSGASRGRLIWRLRRSVGATRVVFLGNDRADEEAFASLRGDDVGIKVGHPPTCAGFSVNAPADAVSVLKLVHRIRVP